MADALRMTLEIGLKGKHMEAVAPGWPGLECVAKTEEAFRLLISLIPEVMALVLALTRRRLTPTAQPEVALG